MRTQKIFGLIAALAMLVLAACGAQPAAPAATPALGRPARPGARAATPATRPGGDDGRRVEGEHRAPRERAAAAAPVSAR